MPDTRGERVQRLAAVLVGAVVASLVAAGCASIPTSGPVRQAGAAAGEPQDTKIRVLPPRPRPGAEPTEIVTGFLMAATSFESDHAIARDYVTAGSRQEWRPATEVVVYDGRIDPRFSPGASAGPRATLTQVDVHVRQTGYVTADGDLVQLRQPVQVKREFTLRREKAEWRIHVPGDGVLIAASDLQRVFVVRDVFFLAPQLDVLVPQTMLVPDVAVTADLLVRRLLGGPTGRLTPAVRSAAPPGTALRDRVTIDADGVATVDLTAQARDRSDAAARQALSAQLVWTLRQVREVRGLRLTVEGMPLPVQSAAEVQQVRESWPQFDPVVVASDAPAYVIRAGRIMPLRGGTGFAPVPGAASGPAAAAISIDGTQAAWIEGDSVKIGSTDAASPQRQVPALGSLLLRPSWDRHGVLWVYDRGRGVLWAIRGNVPVRIPLPSELPGRVTALRVARDGVRIALTTQVSPRESLLMIGMIAGRPGQSTPEVIELREVLGPLDVTLPSEVADLAWVDHRRVALLPVRQREAPVVTDVLGFAARELPLLPAAGSSITAAAGAAQPILVGTGQATVLRLDTRGWKLAASGAKEPVYPG